MSKSVEKEGLFGKYKEHYDDEGKKIGESREREGFFGNYTEHTDNKGRKVGESREREGFFGNYTEHTDNKGRKVGESRERKGFFSDYVEHTGEESNNLLQRGKYVTSSSREFSLIKDFKHICWKETLVYNFARSVFAIPGMAIFLIILSMLDGSGEAMEFMPMLLINPVIYLVAVLPMGLLFNSLSRIGGCLIGLTFKFISLCISLWVILGDPIIFFLHPYFPRLIPIERPKFIQFAVIVFVLKQKDAGNSFVEKGRSLREQNVPYSIGEEKLYQVAERQHDSQTHQQQQTESNANSLLKLNEADDTSPQLTELHKEEQSSQQEKDSEAFSVPFDTSDMGIEIEKGKDVHHQIQSVQQKAEPEEMTYRVVFLGKLVQAQNAETLKKNLGEFYRYDSTKIEQVFFQGKSVLIKKHLDRESAIKLQKILTKRIGKFFKVQAIRRNPTQKPLSQPNKPLSSVPKQYNVVFSGKIAQDKTTEDVKQELATFFNVPLLMCENLFTGKHIILKKNIEHKTAEEYKDTFERTGALCEIEPCKEIGDNARSSQKRRDREANVMGINHNTKSQHGNSFLNQKPIDNSVDSFAEKQVADKERIAGVNQPINHVAFKIIWKWMILLIAFFLLGGLLTVSSISWVNHESPVKVLNSLKLKVLSLLPTPAPTPTSTPTLSSTPKKSISRQSSNIAVGVVITEQDALRVRKGPGTQSQIIGKADKGEKLWVLTNSQEWYKIRLKDGMEGYVFGQYIKITTDNFIADKAMVTRLLQHINTGGWRLDTIKEHIYDEYDEECYNKLNIYDSGDFNADGKIDIAVGVRNTSDKTKTQTFVFWGASFDTYSIIDACKPFSIIGPGKISGYDGELILKGHGIQMIRCESSAWVEYWDGNEFKRFFLSD